MELNKICEKIKERRRELSLTQKDLADALHVSDKLVSKWETGESVPLLEYLQPLSEVLQISMQELMSLEPEQPVSEQPAPVKQKKENKAKNFWKKNRKPILISVISGAAALLLTAVILLSVFIFVPIANKKKYLENIDNGIDRYLERGYFNIRQSEEIDGDEDEDPRILQGYIDGDSVVYYNSETAEIVKDGLKTSAAKWGYEYTATNYVKPANINTVSDLLEEQLKSWNDEEDDLFDIEEYVKYIRKTSYGYYMEFKEEFFTEDLKPSELKNLKFTDKIKGRVEMDGKVTKSITVTIKCRNTKENEDFGFVIKLEFLQTKPVIEHINYAPPTKAEFADMPRFLQMMNAESVNIDDYVQFRLGWGELSYKNGYLYYHGDDSRYVTFYDPKTLSEINEVSLAKNAKVVTVYDGYIWYASETSSGSISKTLCKYDISTKQTTTVMEKINGNVDFNGKYFFFVGNDNEQGFVYDMQQQKKIATAKTILHVDMNGLIYCRRDDGSLYFYGSNKTLQGDRTFNEENGYVYTCDDEHIYQYKGETLRKTVPLSPAKAIVQSGCCYVPNTNVIYDLNNGKVIELSPVALKISEGNYKLAYPQIIGVCDKYIMVGFARYFGDHNYSNEYVGFYRTDQGDDLISYVKADAREVVIDKFGEDVYGVLYTYPQEYFKMKKLG